ncbi:MAG: glycosyltransferase [Lepagella sp.]
MENSFVITDGGERLNRFRELFHVAGFDPMPEPWDACMLPDNPVLGCSVSHYSLVQHALAAKLPYLIVFEDDACPCDDAKMKLEHALDNRPEDCKFLTLGWGAVAGPEQTEEYAPRSDFSVVVGSHAYALFGEEAYRQFLEAWRKIGIADRILDNEDGAYKFVHNLFCQYNDQRGGIHNMPAGWMKDDFKIVTETPNDFRVSGGVIDKSAAGKDDADDKSETINVVYAVDIQHGGAAQFSDQLLASITSIRTSKRQQDRVNVTVLYANIPPDLVVKLTRLSSTNFSVSFNPINATDLQYLQQFTKYQPAGMARTWNGIVFARLYIAKFLPALDKCIYLDSDTLVRRSLHELWRADLGGKMFGMAMGCVPEYGYNSGVMVMDLEKIRGFDGIWGRLEAYMRSYARTFFLPDQTTINRFFAPEITPIDGKWNYCPTPGNRDIRGADAAAIWHFYNQPQKPLRFDEVGQTLVAWNNTLLTADYIINGGK